MVVTGALTSIWEDGTSIESECKVNTVTREVFDIDRSQTSELGAPEKEYIEVNGAEHPVFQEDLAEDGCYWYR